MASRGEPDPILKWAGGKRQLVPLILGRLPRKMKTYYEPFVGGAAVFFALAKEKEKRFERAVLSDRNTDLIALYQAIRDDLERVIEELEGMPHSEADYYRIRDARPRAAAKRAARLIYLNKTGYNGLYRVNSKGEFNVPFGRYARPKICDEPRLRAASEVLQGVELLVEDFEVVCKRAKKGDAVYLDPPYLPVSPTSSFASYHSVPFGLEEHERLAQTFASLQRRNVAALLSNSDTRDTRRLFGGFALATVQATRAINSNAKRRGPVPELLVGTEGR
jgi:DNA adenine methylase